VAHPKGQYDPNTEGRPARGIELRGVDGKPVSIIESKATNQRRKAQRVAAGLDSDGKPLPNRTVYLDGQANDANYLRDQLGAEQN
jgi:hypothetical protein